ncbi:MAG TPA: phosphate ABC transporter permease PstA [Thermohalobaculum sp.]|nr:phosphate ABC transporter permease PstA [Thermohalobaculum sp.]
MTDASASSGLGPVRRIDWQAPELKRRRAQRHRTDIWLQSLGVGAVAIACTMLAILVGSLVYSGWPAFTQTFINLEFEVTAEQVPPDNPERGEFRDIVRDAVLDLIPDVPEDQHRQLTSILSNGAQYQLRDLIVANPGLIGETVALAVPVSDPFDQLAKGLIDRDTDEASRRLDDREIAWFARLQQMGVVETQLNTYLLTNADSRFPELAGLKGALWGSFYLILVCFVISFPLGIGAAIYLEEFAPKNRFTDIVEVNINNLAAVPSIVFGLLALAVFLNWFELPRSAPLVGGLTLSLMTLPTIIIASRAAIKAVPPSVREAALGVGASKHQTVKDFVLPLAMPGIMTGTIIGLAQALGETAPLLLIGMNAFITQAPDGVMDASTALPTQIFIWADSPERGFVSRTSAAICVLLCFLITMNALAVYLRNRFERSW